MRRILLAIALLLPMRLFAATYSVSCPATGFGNCLDDADACTFSDLWSHGLAPDDNVRVLGTNYLSGTGHYTGSACMFLPPSSINGTSGHPITFTVVNPGQVLLDGEVSNLTMEINANKWLTLDGFRVRDVRQANNSSHSVISFSKGAQNNTVKNVGAWNSRSNTKALNANNVIIHFGDDASGDTAGAVTQTLGNVVDTCYTFGPARKQINQSEGSHQKTYNNNTVRNCVSVYDFSNNTGPKGNTELAYNSRGFNVVDTTYFWTNVSVGSNYPLTSNQCYFKVGVGTCPDINSCNTTDPTCATHYSNVIEEPYSTLSAGGPCAWIPCNSRRVYSRAFGIISIMRAEDKARAPSNFQAQYEGYGVFASGAGEEMTIGDIVSVVPANAGGQTDPSGFRMANCGSGLTNPPCDGAPYNLNLTNATSIGAAVNNDSISSQWTQTNYVHLANSSTFTYDGSSGASKVNICVRHNDDGTLQATKRWPFALADDMIQKMTDAGYTAIDEKSEVAAALGAIPAACDASVGGPTPTTSPTPTVTQTFTQTFTPTQTFTFTPTLTRTPTNTPTFTVTPGGPTVTPVPTLTPGAKKSWCKCGHSQGWVSGSACPVCITPTPIH